MLREEPRDALSFYTLGLAEFAAGDEARATAALRKASELRPSEADIQYRLGIILLESEKFAEARGPLAQAVKLAPKVARYRPPLATRGVTSTSTDRLEPSRPSASIRC